MMETKFEYLKNNNVDVDSALTYTGDYDTYDEILKDFYDGISEQIGNIEKYKNSSDMPNYAILVHALKSNARCVGFNSLADAAYKHELESKANNIEFVNNDYSNLINEVDKMKNIVQKYKEM